MTGQNQIHCSDKIKSIVATKSNPL